MAQEDKVTSVLFAVRHDLHPPKQTSRSKRDGHTLNLAHDHVLGGLFVLDTAGGAHEIHEDFVSHTDDVVLLEFARLQFANGVIRQGCEGGKDLSLILAVHSYHEVNVTGH